MGATDMKKGGAFSVWSKAAWGIGLLLPQYLLASGNPVCTNNQITLPGENGPEIWSCVAGSDHLSAMASMQQQGRMCLQPGNEK